MNHKKPTIITERGMNMKRTILIAVLVGLVAMGILAADASAMYNPSTGTFMQRDPGAQGATRVGAGGVAPMGGFVPMDQYADGPNLYQYVRSNPVTCVDPMGLVCEFTIFVDAPGYKYGSLEELLGSISDRKKNDGRKGTGHTWIKLEEEGKETLEGGHTGENKDAELNSEITDNNFLTFTGGLFSLLAANNNIQKHPTQNHPSPMPNVPEADPHNPLRWLRYQYKDGKWQDGHGKHIATHKKTWCLEDGACGKVRAMILLKKSSIKTFGIANNCTSTAAEIASAGGITLDPFVTYSVPADFLQRHIDLVPVIARGMVGKALMYEDSAYATIRFALTQKMADLLAQSGGGQ